MEITQLVGIGSQWQNLKRGTLYRVWAIAPDEYLENFIVYAEDATPQEYYKGVLVVRHTEDLDQFGFYLPKRNVIEWDGYMNPSKVGFYVWARPSKMWFEKFKLINNEN